VMGRTVRKSEGFRRVFERKKKSRVECSFGGRFGAVFKGFLSGGVVGVEEWWP